MKSLAAQNSPFADAGFQLEVLRQPLPQGTVFPAFGQRLLDHGLWPLKPSHISILQVNLGKMCNQVCKHCHVDAGPDRKEIMTRETMQLCLEVLAKTDIPVVDLTGGAPEMNPHFRWFVEEISKLGRQLLVRCNLTIILANPKYHDLPEFFRQHRVQVVSSLPYFTASRTDTQRGDGVFDKSIKALKMLNAVGYGHEDSGLTLDLVYNPAGAFLPGNQKALEGEFKRRLQQGYGITFNNLFAITNLPISRYLDYLISTGNYEPYMEKLVNAFNPAAAANVMCRHTLSVGWEGSLYDCDFNQMLDLPVEARAPRHLRDFNLEALSLRDIVVNQHCFGCTAGAGSSCGGETVA
ncbi:arsenosugar biosynthesis radical SAM (seleno)protein ArsS [Rufibacter glacialis]|uniref:Arsenosugar biosynthesis radical SAM (Seleno)protein ArsS n=1 Tax=Rufibacter glacialis TaxID=1259555 RepID=A0A5M8Q9A6_9BACT|nr:arsenosugar biosynthesis radical SAM (seleno)protein ArsS [Rufibacter glacialis]KAA6432547.1 radical SAM/Cys-rich domain protein [Rufibacter glacialis]GGK79705.1 radical SAM/Cys-rich domain protein [Rufibacter glacialis]